jgi:hypothetical protein
MHGVDAAGQVVIRRQLKRRYVLAFFQKLPPCLIAPLVAGAQGAQASMPTRHRRDDLELGKMSPDHIDHRGLLANEQMTRAVRVSQYLGFSCSGSGNRFWSSTG